MFGWLILAFYHSRNPLKILNHKGLLLTTGLFFLFLFSGVNSENTMEWVHHLRMRLPFLALPMAICMIPPAEKKTYQMIHWTIIGLVTISSLPILYHVISDFDAVYKGLAEGQPIPTPIQHTKYSLFIAYAILMGIVMMAQEHNTLIRNRWVLPVLIVYLIIFLHVLAVRSGLVVFYLSLIVLSAIYALRQKSYRLFLFGLLLAITLPVIGFYSIPSLNKRIHYMVYDINEYLKGGGDQYSDSDRINSLIIGAEIVKENPVLGVGIGDLKDECNIKYREKFGPKKYVLYPHNQYLFIAAATGILGLLAFLVFLWGPLILEDHRQNLYLMALILVFSLGFLFDNALERSFSAGFYAFLLSVELRRLE